MCVIIQTDSTDRPGVPGRGYNGILCVCVCEHPDL